MKRLLLLLLAAAMFTLAGDRFLTHTSFSAKAGRFPNEWFFAQRAFPYQEINYEARESAWNQAVAAALARSGSMTGQWVFAGPLNTGGRISAIAMHPSDQQTVYAGAASGGIFKSTDLGLTWQALFEGALSLSIGDIAIAPSDPDIVYVGTGEANAGGGSMAYDGFGVYRSDNGGQTWTHLGLEQSGSIGRIAVHPADPQTAFVAAMGRLFSNNPERGLYRTNDGGASWLKVLFVSDSTGAVDVVIHPDDPDVVYAVMWERVRRPDRRDYGGPTCGIYKSSNGGDSWSLMTDGLPPASQSVGRIGIDISSSNPQVLYAIYADNIGYFMGLYKTTNGGQSWSRTNDNALADVYASYGWWFGRISVDPADPLTAYVIGFDLYKTADGGQSWSYASSGLHVDQHDLVSHPSNHNQLVLGNDGGVYVSQNGGQSWSFRNNLPITQFYTCEVDEQLPHRLYGGTQDNGTNRTLQGGLDDWEPIYGGDGFYVLVDPLDNDYVYAEYQYGNLARSTDGGYSFQYALNGIDGSDRKNWNTPVVFDPGNPSVLYYGSNRLYRSVNRAVSWAAISPDLTDGPGGSGVVYGTITTIAASPSDNEWIYAGTDDGNVWRTKDGGASWTDISEGLPLRWVTRVAADPYDAAVVYVTLSGYRYDSYQPHVFRSTSGGDEWTDISGDLPEAPANDIIPDPVMDSALYVATDFGVFMTFDLGSSWISLGTGLPNVPVVDIELHNPTRKLVAATYGRSMYAFDLGQLTGMPEGSTTLRNPVRIFPNPAGDKLQFSCDRAVKTWEIIAANGSVARSGKLPARMDTYTISLAGMPAGNFLLVLHSGQEKWSARFVHRK